MKQSFYILMCLLEWSYAVASVQTMSNKTADFFLFISLCFPDHSFWAVWSSFTLAGPYSAYCQ